MSLDIENQTIELIAAAVGDEKKSITYRWLSRSMGYSVNIAKVLMESYLSTLGKGKVHGTYYVARQDPQTGNQTISLVSQEDLQEAKKDSAVIGYHIYSLEPSLMKDLAILSVANTEASQLQKGKDINIYRVVHNKNITISKSNTKLPISAPSSGSKLSSAAKTPAPVKALAAAATSAPTSTKTATTDSKAKPTAKPYNSFFGKVTTAPSKITATTLSKGTTSASKSALNVKTTQHKRKAESMMSSSSNDNDTRNNISENVGSSSDEEVDSEEERDRQLALSSRLDQDQGQVVRASEDLATSKNTLKKRSRSARLLAVDDDDVEDDEDDHGVRNGVAVDEDEDEFVETLSREARIALSKEKEAVQRLALEKMMLLDDDLGLEMQGQGTVTGRRRGHRTVTKRKTFRNERGYMVTEDVVQVESFSEDDTPAPVPAPIRVEKAVQPVKGKTEAGAKKKPGSGNQSLLNFFSKK